MYRLVIMSTLIYHILFVAIMAVKIFTSAFAFPRVVSVTFKTVTSIEQIATSLIVTIKLLFWAFYKSMDRPVQAYSIDDAHTAIFKPRPQYVHIH